jgi:cytochrome P450
MLIREHGDDLSTDELIGIAGLLLLAGHETTSNMLALGTLALLRHPDQLAMIRDDPARIEPAVEELLRWLSIAQLPPRTTTTDVDIAGHTIPANSLVLCSLPAANRDRALIDNPDTLDITREPPLMSPSATVYTTVSGRRWHGWRCASPSPPCCGASPASPWPTRTSRPTSGSSAPCTA